MVLPFLAILLRCLSRRFSRQLTALLRGGKQPGFSERGDLEWNGLCSPRTTAGCLEVGGGDMVQERVHLTKTECIVECLQGSDRWGPVLPN